MSVNGEPNRGDVARGLVGTVSAVVVFALLYQPTINLFWPKLIFFASVSIACVVTARSKSGVLLGIAAIILLRLVVGIGFLGKSFG